MSLNGGWTAFLNWLRVMRGTIALLILVGGGILYAADDRYVQNDDFSERFESLDRNIDELKTQMQGLSITMYESQLVQTELAIAELEGRDSLTGHEQRRLEELRIKRRTLVDKLRRLQEAPPR